ncbi:hypothetical protein SAMN04487947_3539 [Halogeometricum rufum]|uniref:Uncharacterized protein n=1 Tax=Halogeometricum rufum TaxID=553469 RepID=A0A1I6IQI2_9EURY|nr:hypothetical protein SAMN04487947_3539 [Halogeometricum rufum]
MPSDTTDIELPRVARPIAVGRWHRDERDEPEGEPRATARYGVARSTPFFGVLQGRVPTTSWRRSALSYLVHRPVVAESTDRSRDVHHTSTRVVRERREVSNSRTNSPATPTIETRGPLTREQQAGEPERNRPQTHVLATHELTRRTVGAGASDWRGATPHPAGPPGAPWVYREHRRPTDDGAESPLAGGEPTARRVEPRPRRDETAERGERRPRPDDAWPRSAADSSNRLSIHRVVVPRSSAFADSAHLVTRVGARMHLGEDTTTVAYGSRERSPASPPDRTSTRVRGPSAAESSPTQPERSPVTGPRRSPNADDPSPAEASPEPPERRVREVLDRPDDDSLGAGQMTPPRSPVRRRLVTRTTSAERRTPSTRERRRYTVLSRAPRLAVTARSDQRTGAVEPAKRRESRGGLRFGDRTLQWTEGDVGSPAGAELTAQSTLVPPGGDTRRLTYRRSAASQSELAKGTTSDVGGSDVEATGNGEATDPGTDRRYSSPEQHISPLESIVSRHMDADPTLDRLVDTLFDKFERKLRIERERRGR